MSEQSIIFDFHHTKDFFEKRWNVGFSVIDDMTHKEDGETITPNGANSKFQLVISSYCSNEIDDCIVSSDSSSDGTINTTNVDVTKSVDCGLSWIDGNIFLTDDATINLTTDEILPIKSIFLRKKSNGVVLGYSMNTTAFEVTNQVQFNEGTIFWSLNDEQ